MSAETRLTTLDVELTNPGQFLACCGLLELAGHLDPNALGWFDDRRFYLSGGHAELLEQFIWCTVTPLAATGAGNTPTDDSDNGEEKKEPKSPPVLLGDPFNLRLDWWEDDSANEAGFK